MSINLIIDLSLFYMIIILALNVKYVRNVYKIGVGIADITGPAAEINMMGYAKPDQNTAGIHFRLYSRAVIIEDTQARRICFVSCDVAMISQIVKLEVIKVLQQKHSRLYAINNVMISSTHTHSGPGGFLQYLLYDIPSLGFVRQSFEAIRDGILRSIDRAHSQLIVGKIYFNFGQLFNTNINRSPTAYANNPRAERVKYDGNTDKTMTVLKLVDLKNNSLAAIVWFAVHCTSMNNTNRLISGDNKGYASMLFEEQINGRGTEGKGPFVALFPNSNEGDLSPNTKGPHCQDTGLPCDLNTSTCNGDVLKCVASGPGDDMFESTMIIGNQQYMFAKQLFDSAQQELTGRLEYIHQTINMEKVIIVLPNKTTVNTCRAAMGFSFAAGTTDGPGVFPFQQSITSNILWNRVNRYIRIENKEVLDCQFPKPVLLPIGDIKIPEPWGPSIVPTQMFKIGKLLIVSVPSEFTTMAGRRLRAAIKTEYEMYLPESNVEVVISGLSNAYSSYVTTFEEYQEQRYEGASTLYGPHTLSAYIQQFRLLAFHLARDQQIDPGPPEPNYLNIQIGLKGDNLLDCTPRGYRFGNVLQEPNDHYSVGSTVTVTFVSGNPRNDVRAESTFLTVEKLNANENWELIATDASWETKFIWMKNAIDLIPCESTAFVIWDIPDDTEPGVYRIRHFGNYKDWTQNIFSYNGTSSSFNVYA